MPWLSLSKPVVIALAIAGLLALAGAGFWRGMARIEAMTLAAADGARKERDAHWKAELAKSNEQAAKTKSEADLRFAALETDRMIALARAANLDAELERKNAELPKPNVCALDAGRWRLLDGPSR